MLDLLKACPVCILLLHRALEGKKYAISANCPPIGHLNFPPRTSSGHCLVLKFQDLIPPAERYEGWGLVLRHRRSTHVRFADPLGNSCRGKTISVVDVAPITSNRANGRKLQTHIKNLVTCLGTTEQTSPGFSCLFRAHSLSGAGFTPEVPVHHLWRCSASARNVNNISFVRPVRMNHSVTRVFSHHTRLS